MTRPRFRFSPARGIRKSTGCLRHAHPSRAAGAVTSSRRKQDKEGAREMIRTAFAVAVLAFGATAVVAQSDPIAARKALMKANGQQSQVATEMLEAKRP